MPQGQKWPQFIASCALTEIFCSICTQRTASQYTLFDVGCFILVPDGRVLHGFMQPVCCCARYFPLAPPDPLAALSIPLSACRRRYMDCIIRPPSSWFPIGFSQGEAQRETGRREESEVGVFIALPHFLLLRCFFYMTVAFRVSAISPSSCPVGPRGLSFTLMS